MDPMHAILAVISAAMTVGGSTDPLGGSVDVAKADSIPGLDAVYRGYVVAESEDRVHRFRIAPDGVSIDRTVTVEEVPMATDGPHGVAVEPAREYAYVTTGHGVVNGNLWKLAVGPDSVVGEPLMLGRFPATVDVSPDGDFAYVANFNLHGEMVPSSVSVVYLPEMIEVARPETCTMPHGSRFHPDGTRHYSVCMMDDQLVELDTRTYEVARRFRVDPNDPGPLLNEGSITSTGLATPGRPQEHGGPPECSPTWASPSPDSGDAVYVACNGADVVLEVDVDSWELKRTFETGSGPYNLEVTPDGGLLAVTLDAGDAVEFIDLDDGRRIAQVPTSIQVPHGVAITPDSRLALVSVEGIGTEPGRVDVIDLESQERVGSLEVGMQAAGIAVLDMEPLD